MFRNVSPDGRADLLAVDWNTDETIRVDVKSSDFSLVGSDAKACAARKREQLNQGFNIKYLIVADDGDCAWHEDEIVQAANDNELPKSQWWVDMKTGQRFPTPGNALTAREWSYFCYWVLTNYADLILPFSEDFIRDMSVRGRPGYVKHTAEVEMKVLNKFLVHIYEELKKNGIVKEG